MSLHAQYKQFFRKYAGGFFDLPTHSLVFRESMPIAVNHSEGKSGFSINGTSTSDVFLHPELENLPHPEKTLDRMAFVHAFSLARIRHGLNDVFDEQGVPHFFAEKLYDYLRATQDGNPVKFVTDLRGEKRVFMQNLTRRQQHDLNPDPLNLYPESAPLYQSVFKKMLDKRIKQSIAGLAVLSVVDSHASIGELEDLLKKLARVPEKKSGNISFSDQIVFSPPSHFVFFDPSLLHTSRTLLAVLSDFHHIVQLARK